MKALEFSRLFVHVVLVDDSLVDVHSCEDAFVRLQHTRLYISFDLSKPVSHNGRAAWSTAQMPHATHERPGKFKTRNVSCYLATSMDAE